jgi:hypothetical protein
VINVQRGTIDEIIYAQFEQGGDLMLQLHEVCKQENVQTGAVMSITGAMKNLYVQRLPSIGHTLPPTADLANVADIEPLFVDVPGPLEVSGHGIIGQGWAPGIEPPDPRGFFYASFKEHGDPYFHIHIVGTNAETTVCGHLMEGSIIQGSPDRRSHFTVVIAKMAGVHLRGVWDQRPGQRTNFHHELTSTSEREQTNSTTDNGG